MSPLQYFSYPGVGQRNLRSYGFSQAVRVGDRIECAGQGTKYSALFSHRLAINQRLSQTGGRRPETGAYPSTFEPEIQQAFANVDLCLRDAGGKGWSQVFRVNSYYVGSTTRRWGL